ncbi:unnamed protein product [Gadus morhua 'NCC']
MILRDTRTTPAVSSQSARTSASTSLLSTACRRALLEGVSIGMTPPDGLHFGGRGVLECGGAGLPGFYPAGRWTGEGNVLEPADVLPVRRVQTAYSRLLRGEGKALNSILTQSTF